MAAWLEKSNKAPSAERLASLVDSELLNGRLAMIAITAFAFQELACRGEDTKLTFEYPNWQSCVICDEDLEKGVEQIKLLDPTPDRPLYEDLESKINEVLPEPLWMRKMGEVERKGFKFQRGGEGQE